MKKLLALGFAITLFIACQQKDTRYTQQSPEIETVKQHFENYNNKNYSKEASVLADSSKSYFNDTKNPILNKDIIERHKSNDAVYSKRQFLEADQEYEMVVTDEGETWVNAWLDWQGTIAATGKVVEMPIHMTFKMIDNKIVREYGYWDPTEIVMEMQAVEAASAMSADEKAIKSTIDAVITAWNANDQDAMKALMTEDMIRTENGNTTIESSEAYATNLMSTFFTGFPDFKVTLDNHTIVGNKAMINWTCNGTNTGDFQGKTTNKPIETVGMSIWTFNEDGIATREDAYFDNLTIFEQLGYMPEL